ncbi:hypothetical protein V8C43DRAFT_266672 [Trichoderma afarasin]
MVDAHMHLISACACACARVPYARAFLVLLTCCFLSGFFFPFFFLRASLFAWERERETGQGAAAYREKTVCRFRDEQAKRRHHNSLTLFRLSQFLFFVYYYYTIFLS